MPIDGRLLQRERFFMFFINKLLIIAPQAFAVATEISAAQCGQRVNECGQVGGNSRAQPLPSCRGPCGELSPTCPHGRLRHSRFVHTESAITGPEQSGQRNRHVRASVVHRLTWQVSHPGGAKP